MKFRTRYREINELRLTRNQVDWWSTVRSTTSPTGYGPHTALLPAVHNGPGYTQF